MSRTYDDTKTKILIDLENFEGKTEKTKGKTYEGVRITIGDTSTVFFPRTKSQMEHIKKVLEANK